MHIRVEPEATRPDRVHRESLQVRVDVERLALRLLIRHLAHERGQAAMHERCHLLEFDGREGRIDHEPLAFPTVARGAEDMHLFGVPFFEGEGASRVEVGEGLDEDFLENVRIGHDKDRCVPFEEAEDATVLASPFVERKGQSFTLADLDEVAEKERGRWTGNIETLEKFIRGSNVPKVDGYKDRNNREQNAG